MESPFGILMPGAMDGFQVALGGADRTQLFHPEAIHREPKWLWFLQTQPATPPNSGVASSLEDAKAAFKRGVCVVPSSDPAAANTRSRISPRSLALRVQSDQRSQDETPEFGDHQMTPLIP